MRRKKLNDAIKGSASARLMAAISQHPGDFTGVVLILCVASVIIINALFLQTRSHPAPIFASAPLFTPLSWQRPEKPNRAETDPRQNIATQGRSQLVADIQRALNSRGYYDGEIDGIWGSRTDTAARIFIQATGAKVSPAASDQLLQAIIGFEAKSTKESSRAHDSIAALIEPPKRVSVVQRALAELGYGQLKITGRFNSETQMAIEKFERDRHLPITGQISDRLMGELAGVTGRPLE